MENLIEKLEGYLQDYPGDCFSDLPALYLYSYAVAAKELLFRAELSDRDKKELEDICNKFDLYSEISIDFGIRRFFPVRDLYINLACVLDSYKCKKDDRLDKLKKYHKKRINELKFRIVVYPEFVQGINAVVDAVDSIGIDKFNIDNKQFDILRTSSRLLEQEFLSLYVTAKMMSDLDLRDRFRKE